MRVQFPRRGCRLDSLAIVIVNFETPALVVDCLRSLLAEIDDQSLIVVVDNGSRDNSVEILQSAIDLNQWSRKTVVVSLKQNAGYSAGNNAGIRYAQQRSSPTYFLLLNPDTVIRAGAIQTLVQFMREHPTVGIAGSRLEDPDGTPQRSAFRFPSALGELEGGIRLGLVSRLLSRSVVAPPVRGDAHETDWVAGASMIIRCDVIDQIGLMDDGYFLYFEEVDYCLKARRAGWHIWYVPSSRVVHFVGQSTGVTDMKTPAKRVPEYWFASRRRYFIKNHGWLYAAMANVFWAGGYALWRVRRWLQRKPDNDPPGLLGDFVRFNFCGRIARGAA